MENFNLSKFNALFLTGGRDQSINIAVTTDDPEAVEAIKEGFQQEFEHVVIQPHSSVSAIAPLPGGFSAGVKGAQQKIANLVRGKKILKGQVIIGFEEMVCELLPGKWFGLTCLALSDPTSKLEFETFSQSVHIPKLYITKAQESTPSNYTLGEAIIGSGQAHGDWQSKLSGSSKRQILALAARTLAGQFRDRLKACADSLMENAVVM
ncbi:Protein prrc1 [Porites harrisoni]